LSGCTIIHEHGDDFGPVEVIDPSITEKQKSSELLRSQKVYKTKLAYSTSSQRDELLALLDQFWDHFSEISGFCDYAVHEIHVISDFKPKRLKAYNIPERLKPGVEKQINELLALGFIRPSKSQMASPLVCVLKGKDGEDGVRLAVDYRNVNKYTVGDA